MAIYHKDTSSAELAENYTSTITFKVYPYVQRYDHVKQRFLLKPNSKLSITEFHAFIDKPYKIMRISIKYKKSQ